MCADVRFGSKADILAVSRHVRFTPNSGHRSARPRRRSALPPIADIAQRDQDVRFVPIANMDLFDQLVGELLELPSHF
jgi:hypothetical protein